VRADLLDVKAVPAFRARLRSQLTRRIAQVGWTPKPKEPAATTLLRAAPSMAQNYYVVPTNPNVQLSPNQVSPWPTQQFDPLMAGRQQAQQLQNELLRQQIELNRQRLQQQQR
jgi:hypothetical protein